MKFFLLASLSLALLSTLVFGQAKANDDQQIWSSLNKFNDKLYSHLADIYPNDNMAYSPMSIAFAISLVSLGAKSDTHSQMLEALGFDPSVVPEDKIYKGFQQLQKNLNQINNDLKLKIANALFVEKTLILLQTFKDDAMNLYNSEVFSTDFHQSEEAKSLINGFVKKETDGKIETLVSQIDADTVMSIVNTIWFDGKWEHSFDEKLTKEEDFHLDDKNIVKVPMMRREGHYHVVYKHDCTVVKVPYTDNYSAIYIIPNKGKLQEVEKGFSVQIEKWIKEMEKRKIKLFIPRMSISKKLNLKKELSPIGFGPMFSNNADFTGISGDPRLKLSQATHQAVIEVNEKGTRAAAATSIGIAVLSFTFNHVVKVDRPFCMCIVMNDHYTPLFTMRVTNPNL